MRQREPDKLNTDRTTYRSPKVSATQNIAIHSHITPLSWRQPSSHPSGLQHRGLRSRSTHLLKDGKFMMTLCEGSRPPSNRQYRYLGLTVLLKSKLWRVMHISKLEKRYKDFVSGSQCYEWWYWRVPLVYERGSWRRFTKIRSDWETFVAWLKTLMVSPMRLDIRDCLWLRWMSSAPKNRVACNCAGLCARADGGYLLRKRSFHFCWVV